jgi:hypothetical protein
MHGASEHFSPFLGLFVFCWSGSSRCCFWEAENLSELFESTTVKQAQFDPNARDDIAYPEWLEGTWKCQSEMTGFQAPLGNRFLGYFVCETTFLGYF